MESQSQNPEFRINPENFHPFLYQFSYFSTKSYIVGTQKNHLNEEFSMFF